MAYFWAEEERGREMGSPRFRAGGVYYASSSSGPRRPSQREIFPPHLRSLTDDCEKRTQAFPIKTSRMLGKTEKVSPDRHLSVRELPFIFHPMRELSLSLSLSPCFRICLHFLLLSPHLIICVRSGQALQELSSLLLRGV